MEVQEDFQEEVSFSTVKIINFQLTITIIKT